MKTILIVIAGMADLPDPVSLKATPLEVASIPALDMLARRGNVSPLPSMPEDSKISHKNALLTLLGYDLDRGEPSTKELMEYGLDSSTPITSYPSLRPFVLPGFSGHGVTITTSAWVRGAGKCALLKPLDIYSPGAGEVEVLQTIARLATDAIIENEFVFVYVDSPLKASLFGDYRGKIKALELIDKYLISEIADFVWKSDLLINMAVTTDLVTPWHRMQPTVMSMPAILYFNNHDTEGDPEEKFTEVETMLKPRYFHTPSDLIRYLINFSVNEEGE